MKKNYVFALMSAIALTSAVSFTACSSDDAVVDNPNYDATTGEVKTSFTLSIGSVAGTRMTADAVQEDQLFNGMTDIYLFPFKSAVTTTNAASTIIQESYIHLADFNDFNGFDGAVSNVQGKIYQDVNLSVGVNNFLFYGATQAPGNGKLKASYLSMTDNNWKTGSTPWAPSPIVKSSTKVSDLTFDLVPIRRGWTIADVQANDKAVATIKPLNAADAAIAAQITAAGAATDAGKELVAIQKVLRNELTTGTYTSYAGSSNSIKNLMQMLYATLKNKEAALTVGTAPDQTNYATPILEAIAADFTATADATTGEWTLAWKTDPGFPANLGVPDGAAAVQYDADATPAAFKYVTASVDGLAVPSIANYTYPASLYYRVNSPSMVRNSEYLTTSANANATWADVTGKYADGAITPLTRSVIIKDQVQYAVGRLDVQVRVKPETIINDNTKDAPQPVTVPNEGYTLTGVLIGGQKQVGWDFKPIGSAEMTIWDNVTSGSSPIVAKQQADYSAWNHTLALETEDNTSVNIALEFTNTGNDFVGVDNNIIPAGTKFYLVAQLNPAQGKMYDDPEATPTLSSVFTQDYITRVKLTINENSLKSAYNVVPDLRSPKLEFGLSVNLEWQNGLVFEQNF